LSPNSGPTPGAPQEQDPTLILSAGEKSRPIAPELFPTIPDFELLGELGRGGMGIVYKAQRRGDDSIVAVKVIRKDRLQHDDAVRRFRREAQAAARLNHPNVVRVFDSDHTGDTHYLVMEYVAGVTLERFVEQHGPIAYPLAVDFLRQSALALAHADEQGLVHRDIKPSNIMIVPASGRTADGGAGLVKVLDMGVARLLESQYHPGEPLSTLTQGGSVIGTADYVAPEQLEDPHGADVRADLYSLGCTFYFVLVGEVPFPGGSLISKLDKQRWQVPVPVNEVRPEIVAGIAEVIAKLLAKKPADRFQTPSELVAALDELVRTNYVSWEPAGPLPREVRTLKGHAGPVTCVAASADCQRAASAGKDQTIRVWKLATGAALCVVPRQAQEVRAVAFSSAGDRLAAAVGVSVRIFDSATGQERQRLSGHSAAVRCLAFSPDDRWLFSGSDDKTLRVWDLQVGREVRRFIPHEGPVTCMVVSRDGDSIYSGSRDQSLRRCDLRSGQESQVSTVAGGPILGIALSADGRQAATAHFDTALRLWSLESGESIGELLGHKQMVTGVGFLPDGKTLVSTSKDRSLRWWNVETGSEIACQPHAASILALAMAPGTRLALTAGSDGAVRLIEVPG
jgi:tRNA A-37 threonylcarbamoyl transferase component Bud32